MTRFLIGVGVVSAALIAVGAGLIFVPAGLIVGGLEGLASVYVSLYLLARGGERQ